MVLRCLSFLVAISIVDCFRHRKRTRAAKFIAGVPVRNYLQAAGSVDSVDTQDREWIVVVEPTTSDAQIEAVCRRSKKAACETTGHPSSGGIPFFEVLGTEADLEVVLEEVGAAARFVELNPRMNLIPDDDMGLAPAEGDVEPSRLPWHLGSIGLPSADKTGKGVHVYVMDTGIRATHQDFGGRAVPTLDVAASPGAPKECHGDNTCSADIRGHGTHCAGTVGGKNYGVAIDSSIHAVKVLDDKGAGPWSWIIAGLDYIARKKIRPAVASLSLGGPGLESVLEIAVDVVVAAGVSVMVAAGNAGKDACTYTPAFVPSAITVGALTSSNKVAFFSNWGSCANIWAPGMKIVSVSASSNTKTEEKSGTSQACPQVAGGAALLLEANPTMSPADIRASLLNKAIEGVIPSMKDGDTNKKLYVGSGTAPPPTPAPSRRRWWR